MTQLLADDILIAVLRFLPVDLDKFTADREKLHRAFYQMRTANPKALECIRFRDRYPFPESEALDQAFSNLEATGLLERRNLDPSSYHIGDEVRTAYDDSVKSLLLAFQIGEADIQGMADCFRAAVGQC